MAKKILCCSDDATGALDAGGAFHSRGYETVIRLQQDKPEISQIECLILDLNSRYNNPKVSRNKLGRAIEMNGLGSTIPLFLKIDSTLRGNFLSDIDILQQFNTNKPIFIAPAFPFHGRLCVNGVYLIKERPVMETEFVRDRAFHKTSSLIHENRTDTEHINWRLLDKGIGNILRITAKSKKRKFTFDTRDQTDLELIVKAGISIGASMAGSSGLASALPKISDKQVGFAIDKTKPTLFVIGSINQVSRLQRDAFKNLGTPGVELSSKDIGNSKSLQAVKDYLQKQLKKSKAVYISGPNEIVNNEVMRRKIEQSISEVTNISKVMHNLVIVGGKTTRATLSGRNIDKLLIQSEYESGIPISAHPNRPELILTKAGGFGHQNTLVFW
ncbi:four-carbon acid sugar kinase family protein [Patescibacteria group bacterium]|nr:four-carbon acid sugar kinase family protein [Patescibacteria group bacterium]